MNELENVWQDQQEFNDKLRPRPGDFEQRSQQTSEMVLGMLSECDELLRATVWRRHRRERFKPENPERVKMEIADLFKYLVSVCQIWDVGPNELIDLYWKKSMVVRHRWSEEHLLGLKGPLVLVDIDGVLADYHEGFLHWLEIKGWIRFSQYVECKKNPRWFTAAYLGLSEGSYEQAKMEFRTSSAKEGMPLLIGARALLEECRAAGWTIVVMTARPITKYPNLYMNTLSWLSGYQLDFDFLWWAEDRSKAIEIVTKELRDRVVLAIDDDPTQIAAYDQLGIPALAIRQPYHEKGYGGLSNVSEMNNAYMFVRDMKEKNIVVR